MEEQVIQTPENQVEQTQESVQQASYVPVSQMDFDNPDPSINYITDEKFADATTQKTQDSQAASVEPSQNNDIQSQTQIDIDKLIFERSGGKFSKWDDIENLANTPKIELEDEVSKGVYEMIRQNKFDELNTFLEQQKILSNLDNLSAEEAIKLKMRIEDSDAENEDIDYDFSERFAEPEYDLMDEREAARAKRKYERTINNQAKEAKEWLSQLKKEIKLPEISKQEAYTPDQLNKDYEDLNNTISNSVNNALTNFSKIAISIEDKQQGVALNHEYAVSEQDKAEIASRTKDYFSEFQNRYGQGDAYDGGKLARDLFIIDNFDKIVKSAAMNAYNQGKLDKALKTANANFAPEPASVPSMQAEATKEAWNNFFNF